MELAWYLQKVVVNSRFVKLFPWNTQYKCACNEKTRNPLIIELALPRSIASFLVLVQCRQTSVTWHQASWLEMQFNPVSLNESPHLICQPLRPITIQNPIIIFNTNPIKPILQWKSYIFPNSMSTQLSDSHTEYGHTSYKQIFSRIFL